MTRSASVIVTVAFAASLTAQSTQLDEVLSRVEQYLIGYEIQLSAVVAEERYEQWIEAGARPMPSGTGRVGSDVARGVPTRRALVSDFLMMRWPGESAWLGFRDVAMVDGQLVRDREERLLKLFTQPSSDSMDRAAAIVDESTRYNIGGVARNVNVPTQVLDFLHPQYRARFSFRKNGEEKIDGTAAWKIEFNERTQPFLIRNLSGEGVRATGFAWVHPHDGAIIQTQLNLVTAEARKVLRTQIIVNFRYENTLAMRVPVELREMHEQSDPSRPGSPVQVGGRAEYRNFRRFRISTQEAIRGVTPKAK
jgi:hypothetical protein